MNQTLNLLGRGWRVLATAVCFFTFGVGGLLLRIIVFPGLSVIVRNPPHRARLAKLIIHYAFKSFIGMMHILGIYTYEVVGAEKLKRSGLLVLANHPSLIDVVFLISLIRQADCVVKAKLLRNPFTRGPLIATGYICNDEGAGLVDDCIASLEMGNNLVIFPEGTRTPANGRIKNLQRGAANIAVRGGRAITPVIIHCNPPMLTKETKWYQVPKQQPHFKIEVLDDIALDDIGTDEKNAALAARKLSSYLQNMFCREVGCDAD